MLIIAQNANMSSCQNMPQTCQRFMPLFVQAKTTQLPRQKENEGTLKETKFPQFCLSCHLSYAVASRLWRSSCLELIQNRKACRVCSLDQNERSTGLRAGRNDLRPFSLKIFRPSESEAAASCGSEPCRSFVFGPRQGSTLFRFCSSKHNDLRAV